jgi:hypothetical protein
MVHDQSKRTWKMMKTASAKLRRDSRREAGHASTSEWCIWRRPSQGGTLGRRPDTHLHRGQRVEITRGLRFGDLASKSPRRKVFQFGPQNWKWGPSAAGQPGGFLGLGLKTWSGVRCGRTARKVSWFRPQNQGWRLARSGGQEGLVVWASKLPRRPVSRFGPQNRGWSPMRSGGHVGFGGLASKPSSRRVSRF